MAVRVHAILAGELGHGPHIFNARVVLHDRAGVHDVASVLGHSVNHFLTLGPNVVRLAERQHEVRDPARQAELVPQCLVGLENVPLIHVIHNAQVGQFGERLKVMIPIAFGIEQGLMPGRP